MRILHALAQRPGKTGSGVFLQELFAAGYQKGYTQGVLAGIPQIKGDRLLFDKTTFQYKNPNSHNGILLPFPISISSDTM